MQTAPDLGARDASGKSAAFYASSQTNTRLLEKLSNAGSPLNDGSLHEAARNLDVTAVEFLCKAGHHPDFSSSLHEGRSALLEAMLKSYVDTPEQGRHLTAVVKVLREAGASSTVKYEGKSALFCALDNSCALQAVKALLDTDEWKDINADHNLYEDEQGCCFSATMYLQYGLWKHNQSRGQRSADELLTILRQKRCDDRYFVRYGDQPQGATGMPRYLLIAHEERQREKKQNELEDERHQQRLARQRQSTAVELEAIQQKHALSQEQDRERERQRLARQEANRKEEERKAEIEESQHQKRLTQQRQSTAVELEGVQQKHALTLEHDRERASERLKDTENQHQQITEHDKQRILMRQTAQEHENKVSLKHQSRQIEMRHAGREHEIKLERSFLKEKEERTERQHRRNMQEIEAAAEADSRRSKTALEMAAIREDFLSSQRAINASMGQLQVEDQPD